MTQPQYIVAEVSKCWPEEPNSPMRRISEGFEMVIERNRQRGYRLHSWKLSRLFSESAGQINETIIAVFEKDEG